MRGLRWCSAVVSGGGCASIATAAALRRSQTIHNFGRRFCRCTTGSTSSSVLVELEYADLNLRDNYGVAQLGHVRIRQHVNPLTASFTEPVAVPDWKAVFRDPMLPLMVDIGSGPNGSACIMRVYMVELVAFLNSSRATVEAEG